MKDAPEQKTRYDWIDIVKFWGILAIVWGHTLSSGPVHQYLYSFHVPLFFFVIGLYFTSPKQTFLQFSGKKVVSLLIPYFLFAVISILIFSVLGHFAASVLGSDISDNSLPGDLLKMLTGECRANRPLWFLPCMFLFYLFCFGLTRLTEKMTPRSLCLFRLLVIGVSIALCYVNDQFFKIRLLFWKADAAVFMLAFFAGAGLAKPLFFRMQKTWVCVVSAFFFLVLGGAAAFCNTTVGYLANSYGNVVLFYLSAFCSVMGFCFLGFSLRRCNAKWITGLQVYVGQRTLPILLMHKFPILFFQVVFPWTKGPLKNNNALVGLIVAVLSVISCLVVDKLLRKILSRLVK